MFRAVRLSVAETLLGSLEQVFQLATTGDHAALGRSPGTEAAAQWPNLIVGVGLLRRDLHHPALDAHLTLQGRPEKRHGGERVRRQLLALGAFVVSEEGKAMSIQALEQQN